MPRVRLVDTPLPPHSARAEANALWAKCRGQEIEVDGLVDADGPVYPCATPRLWRIAAEQIADLGVPAPEPRDDGLPGYYVVCPCHVAEVLE